MTLGEYLEVNKMTQVELAKLTGVPVLIGISITEVVLALSTHMR